MKKAMILTVGTGRDGKDIAKALSYSIQNQNPSYVILAGSEQTTQSTIPYVIEYNNDIEIEVNTFNEINNIEKLYQHYCDLMNGIVKRGYPLNKIVADFTSGTKAMSSALVLAAINLNVGHIQYVHGERDEQGRVIPGTELIFPLRLNNFSNGKKIELAKRSFNQYQFEATIEILKTINIDEAGKQRDEILGLTLLSEAYEAWDKFNHKQALNILKKKEVGLIPDKIRGYHISHLRKIVDENDSVALEVDLYYNARRRFEEGKYDDAIARLYRLLELLAQHEFKKEFNSSTSDIKLDNIPEKVADFIKQCNKGKQKKTVLGLHDTFNALAINGNEKGINYRKNENEILKALDKRNNSILAHGTIPLNKEKFESFKAIIKLFLPPNISIVEFYKFPVDH